MFVDPADLPVDAMGKVVLDCGTEATVTLDDDRYLPGGRSGTTNADSIDEGRTYVLKMLMAEDFRDQFACGTCDDGEACAQRVDWSGMDLAGAELIDVECGPSTSRKGKYECLATGVDYHQDWGRSPSTRVGCAACPDCDETSEKSET